MSYRAWSESDYDQFYDQAFESIYNNIEGVLGLNDEQQDTAEELFAAGWLTFGEYSPEQLDAIRDEFYDLVGINEDQFDWVEYRELYSDV
jgi:hypothetical protein